MSAVYPRDYTPEEFYNTREMREGNVIKIDTAGGKCIGVFKSLKEGFAKPYWSLCLDPKKFVQGNTISEADRNSHSSDYTIVSTLKKITVLASDCDSWDGKVGIDAGLSSRRSSTELPPPGTLSKTASDVSSVGPVSPIHLRNDEQKTPRNPPQSSPRTKIELQTVEKKFF